MLMSPLAATVLALTGVLPQEATPTVLEQIERDVANVVERARSSLVGVTASFTAELESRQQVTEALNLSGIIVAADGVIVCDGSAVEKAADVKVTLPDGRLLKARLLGSDPGSSVAVLKVEATGLTPAEFAAAKDVRQGTYAIVVGNALGLRASAGLGTVSGTGRSIQVGRHRYSDMLQLTTCVQPGDCGGFVANARGQLIGIVHSSYRGEPADLETLGILRLFGKESADLLPEPAVPMSFATPSETIQFVLTRVRKFGKVLRGWAGLTVRALEPAVRAQLSIPAGEGCEVWSVDPAGPAADVLRRRDVLLAVDGKPLTDLAAFRRWVMELEQPRTVKIVYSRAGAKREGELHLVTEP